MNIQVSVHNFCKHMGNDHLHIRVKTDRDTIGEFIEKVIDTCFREDGMTYRYPACYPRFEYNGLKFWVEMGEMDSHCKDLTYCAVEVEGLWLHFAPIGADENGKEIWAIDMSPEKRTDTLDDFDYTRWAKETELPDTFWVLPSFILKAVLGKKH